MGQINLSIRKHFGLFLYSFCSCFFWRCLKWDACQIQKLEIRELRRERQTFLHFPNPMGGDSK